jgi:hypothetical protein
MNQKQETTERGTAEQKTGVGVDVWQILEARERETIITIGLTKSDIPFLEAT